MEQAEALADVDTRFPYSAVLKVILADDETSISDKAAAERLGVSERQTRNARFAVYLDDYMADKLAQGAGIHPAFLFGYDAWVGTEEDLERLDAEADAADARAAKKRKRKVVETPCANVA